jgi:hypothetical protein
VDTVEKIAISLISLFGVLFGLFVFSLGVAHLFLDYHRQCEATERAEGIVEQLENVPSNDGSDTFRAVVTFTVEGRQYVVKDESSSRPASFHLRQRVTICYPPGRPDLAIIGEWRAYCNTTLFAAFGLLFFTLGSFMIWYSWK